MKRPFSTITAFLLVLMAILQAVRLWFGWPITIDGMAVPTSASASAIGIGLALAIGLWFEARMHANLAYYNREPAPARATPAPPEATRVAKPFTVRRGARYRATIALAPAEQFARNDTIADLIADAGFQDVTVTGVGPKRTAEALWSGSDAAGQMPAQIVSVAEAAPVIASQPRTQPSPSPPQQALAPAPPSGAAPPPPQPHAAQTQRPPTAAPPPPRQAPTPLQQFAADIQPTLRDGPARPDDPAVGQLKPVDARSAASIASRFATALGGAAKPAPVEPAPTPLRPSTTPAGSGSVPSVKSPKPPTDAAD